MPAKENNNTNQSNALMLGFGSKSKRKLFATKETQSE
jgi:hypothetical protein